MIQGLSVLALVTARGGSKGLPGKNVREVGGRPLIDFTIQAARQAETVDRVVLSTDDPFIAKVAAACGCDVPFMRPPELATDQAASIDVVLHALSLVPGYDIVVLLQPTSPGRISADIDAAVRLLVASGAPSCVSVCEVQENPWWMYTLQPGGRLRPLLEGDRASRRQDLPAAFSLNGAVYAAHAAGLSRTRSFLNPDTVAHVMPRERSIDIDTLEDFETFARHQARGLS